MAEFAHEAARLLAENVPLLPMELLLVISALAPIYTGAHASLSRPSSAAAAKKAATADSDDEDESEQEEETVYMEGLTPKDAIVFPITAGLVLAGLYWAIKTYGADVINLILGWYFTFIGVFSLSKLISDTWTVAETFISPTYYSDQGKIWKVNPSRRKVTALDDSALVRSSPLAGRFGRVNLPKFISNRLWNDRGVVKNQFTVKGYMKDVFDFQAILTQHTVISAILGTCAVLYSNLVAKPWWLVNIQGFAVCYSALQLMSPTTFATGSLILAGLFCYDIWAVFFTPLMVTVAQNLDVPIKMIFPRPGKTARSYSMLGLGDIVLPGIMIALALRFDLYLFYLKKQTKHTEKQPSEEETEAETLPKTEKVPYVAASGHWGDKFHLHGATSPDLPAYLTTSFPRPYFVASMIGYTVGMVVTLIAMTISRHAQPALLYLVPGVLISLWSVGFFRGELKQMWEFSEAVTGEAVDEGGIRSKETQGGTIGVKEEGSTLSWLWNGLFGNGDVKHSAQTPERHPASSKADTTNDGPKSSEANPKDDEKKRESSVDCDTVFNFTITRRSRHGDAGSTEVTQETARRSFESLSNADSDVVVVRRPDVDAEVSS